MWLTTSWDDGHPLDLRLAELLHKHGIAGTFYCPISNREGLPTLDAAGLRQLAASALVEVGSHTLDHAYATHLPPADWAAQVRQGKTALEQALGHRVAGFCYPGGKHPGGSRQTVVDAGFDYARTGQNFRLDLEHDPFMMPTTLQVYPHTAGVLLRNLVKGGQWTRRAPTVITTLRAPRTLSRRLHALLDWAGQQGDAAVLHLWGHSWEIEAVGIWAELDAFFAEAAQRVPRTRRVTNLGLMQALNRVAATQTTRHADDTSVRANPTCP